MSTFFDQTVWPWLLRAEGKYSVDPNDRGNWTGGEVNVGVLRGTKYGISAKAYPSILISDLTEEQARDLYRRDYWDKVRGDDLPRALALAVMDCAVNQGVERAANFLQTALRCSADGAIGPVTVAKARTCNVRYVLGQFLTLRALAYMQAKDHATYEKPWVARLFTVAFECASLMQVTP